ncbi:MAG: 8-amino-7-oxononanoate synthase, partial [Gammaproteobacteria bacterium]
MPHDDAGAVDTVLATRTPERALVVVESVDSVGGGVAPLRALHAVCRARGALLVVDEADALRTAAERSALWRALAWLTENYADAEGRPLTVVASCHDPAEAVATVPPDR